MTHLKLGMSILFVFVLSRVRLHGCNKIRKFETSLDVLKAKYSDLEDKMYTNEIKMRNEMEDIWKMCNASLSGEFGDFENERNAMVNENEYFDSVVEARKKLEDRRRLITKGFVDEKAQLRKRVEEIETQVADMSSQHEHALGNLKRRKDEFVMELARSVNESLNRVNSTLEDKVSDAWHVQSYNFKTLNTSYNEQFADLKQSIEDMYTHFEKTFKQTMQQLEIEQNEKLVALMLRLDKALSDNEHNINIELNELRTAKEESDSKADQFEAMIQTVKDISEDCSKKMETVESSIRTALQLSCTAHEGLIFENSCYLLSSKSVNWQEAVDECSKLGAHVAEVNSLAENEFLRTISQKHTCVWLGASDLQTEGEWIWQHSNQAFEYANWHVNEPNGIQTENCLHVCIGGKTSGTWNDLRCNTNSFYVCELSLNI